MEARAVIQPMRILHVITTLSRGGAENQLVGLAGLQKAAGHQVHVAYLKLEGYWRKALEEQGVGVTDLAAKGNADPMAASRLRHAISVFSPTLINAHMQPAELCTRLALLWSSKRHPAFVITKHNLNPFFRFPGEEYVGRWVARRADGVIAVSAAVKELCERNGCAAAAGRVVTIHNAIDVPAFRDVDRASVAAVRAGWGVRDEEYLIGTTARLLPLKGIDILIRGFADYLPRSRRRAKLVITGAGPLENELKALAASLGLDQRVIFAGFRADMPAVMNAIDVFALTSNREAFGMVVIEALAAGRPIIATNVGGIPEIVVDGVHGVMIPPRQPAAVTEALLRLEDEPLRTRMSDACRRKAAASYGLERMFRDTMDFYSECAR